MPINTLHHEEKLENAMFPFGRSTGALIKTKLHLLQKLASTMKEI